MKINHISNNTLYSIASFLSPILSALIIYIYQTVAHIEFWSSEHSSEFSDIAGTTMLAAEAIQILLALIVGLIIGLVLSLRSLYIIRSKSGIFALTFNTLPLSYLIYALIKL